MVLRTLLRCAEVIVLPFFLPSQMCGVCPMFYRRLSKYDERFMGYGNDKQSKIFKLYAQGAYFVVLPNSFLIHQWHKASKIWSGPCERTMNNNDFGDHALHQVMCNYVEEIRETSADDAARGKPWHPNAKLASHVPARHLCWAPRCPGNVRVRVDVDSKWELTLHTYQQMEVSDFIQAVMNPL